MPILKRFVGRRLAAVVAVVVLGSGVSSVGLLSAAPPAGAVRAAASCGAGQTLHKLTAQTNVGTITGTLCAGSFLRDDTYTQDPVGDHPSVSARAVGIVEPGFTQIFVTTATLHLAAVGASRNSFFDEKVPVEAHGTFSLT
jgi:hypothetical protein